MHDWEQELDAFFEARGEVRHKSTQELLAERNEEARQFIDNTVRPALERVRLALGQYGREVLLSHAPQPGLVGASLRVRHANRDEFGYLIGTHVTVDRVVPYVQLGLLDGRPMQRRTEVPLRAGSLDYTAADITQEEVIHHILGAYRSQQTERVQR